MELTASTKFLHLRLQDFCRKGNSLWTGIIPVPLATRNKCFGAEIKVKIVNHIKPWKLKEETAVFILFNLQDNSKMLCLICQKVNLLLEKDKQWALWNFI